jgi:hypothetical protein
MSDAKRNAMEVLSAEKKYFSCPHLHLQTGLPLIPQPKYCFVFGVHFNWPCKKRNNHQKIPLNNNLPKQ